MEVNFADLTELSRDLQAAGGRTEADVQALLEHAGTQIQAAAITRAPVRTGRLRNSIRMWVQPLRVEVGPQVPYASYVEYGTGTRGEFPTGMYVIRPKQAKALRFTVGDKVVFTREVHHPGSRPHPYMRPALTDWVSSLGADAAKVGVSLIVGPNA